MMTYTDDGFPLIHDGNIAELIAEGDAAGAMRGYNPELAGPFGSSTPESVITRLPRNTWADHMKRQEEEKSSPFHWFTFGGVKVLNQGSWGYCTTEDTEVLTTNGWRSWTDYDGHSPVGTVNPLTHQMEFQTPLARQIFEYSGEMIYSTHNRLDFGVTPNHRMYVRKWDESNRKLSQDYSFVEAKDLGWYSGLMGAPSGGHIGTELVELEVEGDRRYDGDDFLALLSLVISDGFAGSSDSTKNWVSFCCFNQKTYHAVAAIAARVGFHEKPSERGVFVRYDAAALAEWIRKNCYTGEQSAVTKRIPEIVKCASQRQITHFLQVYGDQRKASPLTEYYTSSKVLADDLQELFLRIGKRATIQARDPRASVLKTGKTINGKQTYQVRVAASDKLSIEAKHNLEQDKYTGNVFCLTVPNGTLVTRRNGSVLISGNCWMYGLVGAMQTAYAMTGQVPPHLNAHYPAWLGKGGANRGGWAGEALGYVRSHGVPEMSVFSGHPTSRALFDRGEVKASAEMHKVVEFGELPRNDYEALVSVLLDPINPRPVTMGLNWWGHLIYAVRAVKDGILIVNSWGENWGQKGLSVLAPNKSVAFEQIAVERVAVRQTA